MGWINLEERKPPNGVYVLIAVYDYRPNVKLYHVTIGSRLNNQWEDAANGEVIQMKYGIVTHWMPLPDCPEVANENCR